MNPSTCLGTWQLPEPKHDYSFRVAVEANIKTYVPQLLSKTNKQKLKTKFWE